MFNPGEYSSVDRGKVIAGGANSFALWSIVHIFGGPMITLHRIVIGGDKPYEGVQLMLPGEMDDADVSKIFGDDKTIVFSVPGERRVPKWFHGHANNLSLIMVDSLNRKVTGSNTGTSFERIVLGNSSFGPGYIVPQEEYEAIGIPRELLDSGLVDQPVVFVVAEGLCVAPSGGVATLQSSALAPKARKQDMPAVTSEPLVSDQVEMRGPSQEQIDRANSEWAATKEAHGGPPRGTGMGGSESFSEVGTSPSGDPVSRDITRGAVQDQGPGREGGPVNPPSREFDPGQSGDVAGHGKFYGQPEGARRDFAGQTMADRASNFNESGARPDANKSDLPPTNAGPDRPHTVVKPPAPKSEPGKAPGATAHKPAPKQEQKPAPKGAEQKSPVKPSIESVKVDPAPGTQVKQEPSDPAPGQEVTFNPIV